MKRNSIYWENLINVEFFTVNLSVISKMKLSNEWRNKIEPVLTSLALFITKLLTEIYSKGAGLRKVVTLDRLKWRQEHIDVSPFKTPDRINIGIYTLQCSQFVDCSGSTAAHK